MAATGFAVQLSVAPGVPVPGVIDKPLPALQPSMSLTTIAKRRHSLARRRLGHRSRILLIRC